MQVSTLHQIFHNAINLSTTIKHQINQIIIVSTKSIFLLLKTVCSLANPSTELHMHIVNLSTTPYFKKLKLATP